MEANPTRQLVNVHARSFLQLAYSETVGNAFAFIQEWARRDCRICNRLRRV